MRGLISPSRKVHPLGTFECREYGDLVHRENPYDFKVQLYEEIIDRRVHGRTEECSAQRLSPSDRRVSLVSGISTRKFLYCQRPALGLPVRRGNSGRRRKGKEKASLPKRQMTPSIDRGNTGD